MKQHLLNSLILLFALIAGTATSWADSYTYDFSSGGTYNSSANPVTNTWETSYFTILQEKNTSSTAVANYLTAPRWYQNHHITITPATGVTITQIVINCGGTNNGQTISASVGSVSSNGNNSTWSGSITSASPLVLTMGKQCRPTSLNVTYSSAAAVATPTFSVAGGTYTTAQSVELACTTDGATIRYTLDGTEPTESSTEYTSAIAVSTTTTIKAKAFKGEDASNVATATYTILPVVHAGTAADPYTVADARNAIDANTGLTNVYVKGIVCEGGSSLSSGAMNYWISDDGSETDKFEIYKGKGLDGANFTATSDVQEGDVVVVYGNITKFNNTTYEFSGGSQIYSFNRPVVPTILTTSDEISELAYVTGNGPSAAQTFKVSGSNLTADITLTLNSSNFEMSLSEGNGYTNSLTLTQTAGAVAETTVYVRLKEGLEINNYAGTITLTSADATDKTIDLTGSVTPTKFTWDLSTNQTNTATEDEMTWVGTYATMEAAKANSTTNTNNYYPGSGRTSTRFYANSTLTITPASGYMITSVEFTATTENYATALATSTWDNASAAASETTVTVTPTDGVSAFTATIGANCGFTAVTVYYQAVATINLAAACTDGEKCYGTYSNSKAFIVPADLTVYEVWIDGGEMLLEAYATNEVVPANTGVLVAGTSGDHNVMLTTGGTSKLGTDNMLRATGTGIDAAAMAAADASCKFYRLTMHEGTQIGFFWGAENGVAFDVAANKAYLAVPDGEAGAVKGFRFGENTDAISELTSDKPANNVIYDLSGRRVMKPTKGLYIVNGKKVVK